MFVNQELFRLIKINTLYKGVPETYLKLSLMPKKFIKVEDGKILYSCNEEASEIYLVIEGEVKIKFRKEKIIEFKILFDFFGEAEILEESKRFSSAVANRDCVLYKMSIAELKDLCEGNKSVIANLNKKDQQEIKEFPGGETPDLDLVLDADNPTGEIEIIDFDQEKEEEMLKEHSEEDLNIILEKRKSKHELDGDLNDKQNFEDEDSKDLSSDKSGEN